MATPHADFQAKRCSDAPGRKSKETVQVWVCGALQALQLVLRWPRFCELQVPVRPMQRADAWTREQKIMHPRILTVTVDRRSVKCLWRGVRKTPARLGVCKFNAAVRRCGNKLWTTVA